MQAETAMVETPEEVLELKFRGLEVIVPNHH